MPSRLESILQDPLFRREAEQAGLTRRQMATLEGLPPVMRAADFGRPMEGAPPPGPEGPPPTLEAVILLQGRPSLLVRKNRFEMPRSGIWADLLNAHRSLIEARLPSIGRIEVNDGAGFKHTGTGWVIAEGIIITNRHVAQVFAQKVGEGGRFMTNFMGQPYQAQIDFREEYQEQESAEVPVEEIIFLQDADRSLPDMALLRLKKHGALPDPIPLLETAPKPQAFVVVVGYPAYDPRYGLEAEQAAQSIFGQIYDVKRLSPGKLVGEAPANWYFSHDATTLGGNSGSVVLDMETGYAVGLHFSGSFKEANYAVRAATVLDQAARTAVPVLKRQALPEAAPAGEEPEVMEEAAPQSYANRKGYQAKFLGDDAGAPLPKVTRAQAANVLKFKEPAIGKQTDELKYTHFSVVMNKDRRMCFFSAVNIDGKTSVSIKGKRPSWRFDPRIPSQFQIVGECYGAEQQGKFSRGHMTRREDPNWGLDAAQANADTFHATNATPQIQPFNAGVWNNLEDYALENARQDDMRISVFTGPIFTDKDPEYFGVQIPTRFWKVVAFIHDKTRKLCATGYTMSQQDLLPGQEFVFGRFQTYQTALKEIEGLTGLSFGPLTALDPMKVVDEAPPIPLRAMGEIRFE